MIKAVSRFILIFCLFSLYSRLSLAQATFGAEFTFTNDLLKQAQGTSARVHNEQSELYRDKMAEQVLKTCHDCQIIQDKNSYGIKTYKVQYPDGFYFIISTDPAVIEVQTKPMTTTEIDKNAERMQRDIFDAAAAVHMAPDVVDNTGGGHIHIGYTSTVNGDLLLMRNIMVDFANHPELANGILRYDHINSPPIEALPELQREAFAQIIADVDAKIITDVTTFVKRIHSEVYNWHPAQLLPTEKYQAINLTRIIDNARPDAEKTSEIRAVNPQKSIAQYQALTHLFEGRIEYLKTLKRPLELYIPMNLNAKHRYTRFADYASKAGVDYVNFLNVMEFDKNSFAYRITAPKASMLCYKLFRD